MLLSLLIGRKVYAVTFSSANMVDLLWLMYVIYYVIGKSSASAHWAQCAMPKACDACADIGQL